MDASASSHSASRATRWSCLDRVRRRLLWVVCAIIAWQVLAVLLFSAYQSNLRADFQTIESVKQLYAMQNQTFFFAALLHNSEHIMDNFVRQLLTVIDLVGPSRSFVSIVENGSKDATKVYLKRLKAELAKRGAAERIEMSDAGRPKGLDRITYLAGLRNRALEPLLQPPAGAPQFSSDTVVVFINDIYFHALDIARLLVTGQGQFDLVCGLDFYYTFYDQWVARDNHGLPFVSWYPFVRDEHAARRVRHGLPFGAKCCWNGVAVFRAAPILQDGVRFRTARYEHDCAVASECLFLCHDLLRLGYGRILVNPNVQVAYAARFYYLQKYALHPLRHVIDWLAAAPPPPHEAERSGTGLTCGF